MRQIVIKTVFGGSGFFLRRIIERRVGAVLAKRFSNILDTMLEMISMIEKRSINMNRASSISNDAHKIQLISNMFLILQSTLNNFQILSTQSRRNTSYQQSFYSELKSIVNCLKEIEVFNPSIDSRISLWELFSGIEGIGISNFNFYIGYSGYSSDNTAALLDLRRMSISLQKRCLRITNPGGYAKMICAYLFDSTFGSCDQMRVQLETDYSAMSFDHDVGGKKINTMIIIPSQDEEESERMKLSRLSSLEKKFEDQGNLSISARSFKDTFNTLDNIAIDDDVGYECDNLVIICQPNASFYELQCYDNKLLNFYLERGYTVVLWNYRGYGRSTGASNMTNIVTDAKRLLHHLKEKLAPKKIIAHGRSLGGHVARALSTLVDLVVTDRTFFSISK